MKVFYRPCRERDLLPAFKMIRFSLNHLRRNSGKEPIRYRARRLTEVEHLYNRDRATFWCAWAGKNIVGFAAALVRGRQWYLAFLFVHPRYQDKGVGQELIRHVWRSTPGMTHSLSTFAYNMQAVGIYSKFGLAPLCLLPLMELNLKTASNLKPIRLETERCSSKRDLSWINMLEKKIRGYERPSEWRFWLNYNETEIFLFKDKGKRVGYCVVYKQGFIGPAGAISNKYLTGIISAAIGILEPKCKSVKIYCPSVNQDLYGFLIGLGFRLSEMELFMSDRPYADFQRYVSAQLAIF